MPLYEYRCNECGKVFEVMQRFSDEPLTTHEGCGGAVERLLSAPALQFKGSGWYITDYARSGGGTKSGSNGSNGASKPAESKSSDTSSSTSTSSSSTDKK